MPFRQRYLLWVLLPGAVVSVPLSLIFLSQVIQLDGSGWLKLIGAVALLYVFGGIIFSRFLTPQLIEVERAIENDHWVSEALSATLTKTLALTLVIWLGGGLVFAIAGTLLIWPTLLGFSRFLVATLIAAAPSLAWAYIAAKRILVDEARAGHAIRYVGRQLSIARKIAIVFIIFFIISVAALVQLVSAKVSDTLENLALESATEEFQQAWQVATTASRSGDLDIDKLAAGMPAGHMFHLITAQGTIFSAGKAQGSDRELTSTEIATIRSMRNGDSSQFAAEHVSMFRELPDRSILVLTIPWRPYANIPFQIAFYTALVALLTTMLFSAATYFLSRDITSPMKELMNVSAQMASGNFTVQPRLFSDDEVGSLGTSFAETRDNLRSLLGRVGGSGTTITDGVRVITGGTETLLNLSNQQTEISRASSAAVDNVRGGAQSVLSAAETVSELTQDVSSRALELQASAEEVAKSMDYLFQSVDKTSSSTTQMDASATSMSERTDVLANISEEVLTFVTEMDSTIEELRRNAIATAEISRKVLDDAAAGTEAVTATVEGISEAQDSTDRTSKVVQDLQGSIGQITQILTVIEEITDRTNLLSLNAAIIAAQAGEQGSSFTVVANEIRQLAERTRGSTKEISGIIKAVQSRANDAVRAMREGVSRVKGTVSLARNASESLQKIRGSADQSYEMANRIASALEQQAQASRHLHQVTSRMSDNISEINNATTEQARGTRLMAAEAERVREIALQVKNATEQQSVAGAGIAHAMEQIATDVMRIRDLLENQLQETERISKATSTLMSIAQENNQIAQSFTATAQGLVSSGQDFEREVARFRIKES